MDDIKGFVEEIIGDIKDKVCYLALMPYSEEGGMVGINIEVEVQDYIIAGTYDTKTTDLEAARAVADSIDAELAARGIKVVEDRDEWDELLLLDD